MKPDDMLDLIHELIVVSLMWKLEKYVLSFRLPEDELHKLQTILRFTCLNQIDTF